MVLQLVWHPTLVKISILCINCISSDKLANISLHRQAQSLQITKKSKVNIDNTLLGDSFNLNPFLFFKAPFLAIHMATTDIWPCARKIKGRYKKFFWSFFSPPSAGYTGRSRWNEQNTQIHHQTVFPQSLLPPGSYCCLPKKPWLTHISAFTISTWITHFFYLIEVILSPTPSVTNHKALQTACPTVH